MSIRLLDYIMGTKHFRVEVFSFKGYGYIRLMLKEKTRIIIEANFKERGSALV